MPLFQRGDRLGCGHRGTKRPASDIGCYDSISVNKSAYDKCATDDRHGHNPVKKIKTDTIEAANPELSHTLQWIERYIQDRVEDKIKELNARAVEYAKIQSRRRTLAVLKSLLRPPKG